MSISGTSRKHILNRVQKALKRDAQSPATLDVYPPDSVKVQAQFDTLAKGQRAPNPVGISTDMSRDQVIELFIEKAGVSNTPIDKLKDMADVVAWMSSKVDNDVPICCQNITMLKALDWEASHLKCTDDYTLQDQWGIVQAECAIAETGSVVLASGAHHAIASGFLADKLAVVVRVTDIVNGLEDIWPVIDTSRASVGLKAHPRAVNIITGPSRTADVEQKVQLGAHGPRELHIALVLE